MARIRQDFVGHAFGQDLSQQLVVKGTFLDLADGLSASVECERGMVEAAGVGTN